jgi:hypothetical protein
MKRGLHEMAVVGEVLVGEAAVVAVHSAAVVAEVVEGAAAAVVAVVEEAVIAAVVAATGNYIFLVGRWPDCAKRLPRSAALSA